MKKISGTCIAIAIFATGISVADPKARKLTCCQDAAAAGRECAHRCCQAAHQKGKSCQKCNPGREDLILAKITNRTFYVQLVRGSDEDMKPSDSAKRVGPKLQKKLASVFKWKSYWEVERESVLLQLGRKTRKTLALGREIEMELPDAQTLSIWVYLNNRLTRSRRQPAEGAFYVTGDNDGAAGSWFIVVRGDHPAESKL